MARGSQRGTLRCLRGAQGACQVLGAGPGGEVPSHRELPSRPCLPACHSCRLPDPGPLASAAAAHLSGPVFPAPGDHTGPGFPDPAVPAGRGRGPAGLQPGLCRPCPSNWEPFQGSCYLFSWALASWEASVASCQALGAQLVIVNSAAEQRFLNYWDVRRSQRTWIGLSDHSTEGSWHWVDGSPLQLSFWKEGEPNNAGDEDCAELFTDGWNDGRCTVQNFWICEQPAAPCPGL